MSEKTFFIETKSYAGTLIRFDSLLELKRHIEAEQAFISSLSLPNGPNRGHLDPVAQLNQTLGSILSHVNQALAHENVSNFDKQNPSDAWRRSFQDVQTNLNNLYTRLDSPPYYRAIGIS